MSGGDYALTDTGFNDPASKHGWLFGDFNYDCTTDFQDYALVDTGFIAQTMAL